MAFQDFRLAEPISSAALDLFADRVPPQMVEMWHEYGQGFVGDGFLRVLDPAWLWSFFPETVSMSSELVPLFATAFGDIIVYHDGYYEAVMYRYNRLRQLFPVRPALMFKIFEDPGFIRDKLANDLYAPAVAQLGVPAMDEAFAFVPMLSMGGREDVTSLRRAKLREHILLLTDAQGPVRTFTTAEIEAGEDAPPEPR